MFNMHTQKGFSLVEMLVYIAVLVLVSMAVVLTFFSLRDTFERNRVERELADAATNVLERIGRDARNAESIDVLLSTLGTSPGTLVLNSGATTTSFYIATGTVAVSVNSSEIGPLVPQGVSVDSLIFRRYTNAATEAVRIELILSVSGSFASSTKSFYTTAVLRGSYD